MSELLPHVAEDLFLMPVGGLFAQELLESSTNTQQVASIIMPRTVSLETPTNCQLKIAA
jgi:hypothetical protein